MHRSIGDDGHVVTNPGDKDYLRYGDFSPVLQLTVETY
jgi:hypothetical protein